MTRRFLRARVFRVIISVLVVLLIASSTVFILYYNRYAQVIDIKLSRVFPNTAKIYAVSTKLVTNLSGESRAKRRLIEFKEIPKVPVDAVTAGEDQSFFRHHGWIPFELLAHSFRILTRRIDCKVAVRSRSSLRETSF